MSHRSILELSSKQKARNVFTYVSNRAMGSNSVE